MSLERNETARRFMEALLHAGEPQEIAKTVEIAVGCADALLAALVPAATPAAWVPSVGDVVKQMTETDAVAEIGAIRVVVSTNPLRWVYVENGAKVGGACEPKGWEDEVRFVRRATSSERAAAGLPVDESAVDRVALAKAIYAAVAASNPTLYGKPWDEAKDVTKRDAFNAADAAIAFMAKGCAS